MFEPAPHAVVASRYRLLREIGRGGMGAVWEGFDLQLEAPCALKFILDEKSKQHDVRVRFMREARAVARLQSPHVVTIRSVDEWDGALYIAMELLVGETLADRLARQGKLSAAETSRIIEQLASALLIAHRASIVHRDLKPENIWLWGDGEPFVKLLDFGIAKLVAEPNSLLRTATGKVIGTPHYMSPEQAAGDRQVDHRSDLWSLAVIAVECLSGKRVFQAGGMGQLLANIINGPTPSLVEHYPDAGPDLKSWWQRSTAKRPEERYSSAPELSREFSIGLGLTLRSRESLSNARARSGDLPAGDSSPAEQQARARPEATQTGQNEPPDGYHASAQTQSVLPLSNTRSDVSAIPKGATPALSVRWRNVSLIALGAALLGGTWVIARPRVETVMVPETASRAATSSGSALTDLSSSAMPAVNVRPAMSAGGPTTTPQPTDVPSTPSSPVVHSDSSGVPTHAGSLPVIPPAASSSGLRGYVSRRPVAASAVPASSKPSVGKTGSSPSTDTEDPVGF